MGTLMERHNETFYGSVPVLCEAIQLFAKSQARTLIAKAGEVFVKHGLTEEFGLVMVHRHFDLTNKEILVESVKDDETMSIAIPWSIEDHAAVPHDQSYWQSMEMKPKNFVVPQTWGYSESGKLTAFEFISTDEKSLPPNDEFASELFQILKNLGIERIVGLRRIHGLKEKKIMGNHSGRGSRKSDPIWGNARWNGAKEYGSSYLCGPSIEMAQF